MRVRIAAPPEVVFELVRDVRRWPAILPHYHRVRPLRRRDGWLLAEYVALRPLGRRGFGLPVVWRSWSFADPATLELAFRHDGGLTDGMVVRWRIAPSPGGSIVEIEHRFERPIPVPGRASGVFGNLVPLLVDGLVVRPVARLTLRAVKVEAECAASSAVGRRRVEERSS